jgi:hypothetical protein
LTICSQGAADEFLPAAPFFYCFLPMKSQSHISSSPHYLSENISGINIAALSLYMMVTTNFKKAAAAT